MAVSQYEIISVSGFVGAVLDVPYIGGTAATNALQVGGVYTQGGIFLVPGQASSLQVDNGGNLLVKHDPSDAVSTSRDLLTRILQQLRFLNMLIQSNMNVSPLTDDTYIQDLDE